ncbi:hypothetical protein BG015_003179 [Linnemannia schmuckeri]|uniref:Uncharacterized protein n=1 Tax=Linnemannia schmuckeri TaxID=64567 RepID=A0A9P5VD88_9FUNG|nr:hypothetical protein BG015_003179 [Linnemannia schmuckeri]
MEASWGSPSAPSTAALASVSSAGSSPTADGTSPLLTAVPQGQASDSPQPDAQGGSTFQKTTPRAWGAVAQTSDSNLAEYPTAAEAAKKTQEHQVEHHQGNGNLNHTSNSTSATKSTTGITPSGEPMAKTVSAMSGGDNWDEADDDEGVDFLNAEAIEFADGSVVVAAAVAQTIEIPKEAEPPLSVTTQKPTTSPQSTIISKPTINHHSAASHPLEERVIDRGDVDFNRSLPNRTPPTAGHSLYQPNHEQGSRFGSHDRNHPSLWQGGSSDRRPSSDRTQGYHHNQRRESFGNRDHSGPPRRDSYDRREPPNRSGSYSRDRDMPYRDNDYGSDRRLSHDRQSHGGDRFSDRPPRDYQVLSRSKDRSLDRSAHFGQGSQPHSHPGPYDRAGPLDRVGPHDIPSPSHRGFGHHLQSSSVDQGYVGPSRSKEGHDSRLNSYGHMAPPGAVEYDRPAQVSEEQREAMKHAADEARRRRQEEETKYEEARARAKAKADELAKKAEEAKLATEKEEQEAREKEELAAKEKLELEARKAKERKEAEAERQTNLPATVKEFGNPNLRPHMLELTDEEQKDALAKWQALPGRLAKEDADRTAQNKERRLLEAEQRAQAANEVPAPTAATNSSTASTTPAVGPWRRGQPLPKAKAEPEANVDSAASATARKDEKLFDIVKPASPSTHGVIHEPRVEQLDKVMHRIEESFHSRGNSVQAMEANMKRPADHSERTTQTNITTGGGTEKDKVSQPDQTPAATTHDKALLKEKSRNAKASRAERSGGDSSTWRKDDKVTSIKDEINAIGDSAIKNPAEAGKSMATTASAPRPIGNGRMSRSAAAAYSKGNYPAKVNGAHGAVKIADITRIHARLSLQSAGDQELELGHRDNVEDKSGDHSTSTKSEASKPSSSAKRNSLLASSAATIFPVNVEKAAKNRGSMSFMVESEIDPPHIVETAPADDITTVKTPLETSAALEDQDQSSKESSNQTWSHVPEEQQQFKTAVHPQSHGGNHVAVPHTLGMLPAGSNMHMFDASVNRGHNQHAQAIWGSAAAVDATSQAGAGTGGAHPVMMAAPGVSGPAHPPQPYPVMMPPPYYIQGYPQPPYYYQRPMAPTPHMNAFPGAGMPPPFGTVPPSSVDARGSPEPTSQALNATASGSSDLQSDASSQAASSPGSSILGPHHWLPRFSVAGDAPPQQAVVSAGPFLVPAPTPQQGQANIMAAANINRVPQPRPYGHHPHPQMMHQQPLPSHSMKHPGRVQTSGPASLESSFQEGSGSPTTADGWNSGATPTSSSSTMASPASSGGRNHGPGQMHSWAPGAGRAGSMGGVGVGPSGTYGNYQPMPHHVHPNGGRGGRGGYGNYHPSREFRPRGGYVGHLNQPHLQGHPSSYSYSHHHQQHGGQPTGVSSGVSGSMDSSPSHSHQHAHQHPQHLATPQPPRVSHSAVVTPASTNALSF